MSHETVYAIASGKGGVGKTTTSVNVGTALAGAGNTVAVVDADLGMANLAGLVSLSPEATTLHEVLAGDASVEAATYELADGIVAVPSGADLESYADVDAAGLRDVVARLREEFDYVLLDVGAGVSHESVLPLGLADGVVLVTTPEPASVQDASKTADLTERAEGSVAGLVITRVRDDRNFDFEGIADRVGVPLLGTVPEDDAVRDSVYSGTPVVVDAPESPAATAYRRLTERLVGDGEPDPADDADAAASAESDTDADDAASEDTASHTEVSSAIPDAEDGETGNRTGDDGADGNTDPDGSETAPADEPAGANDPAADEAESADIDASSDEAESSDVDASSNATEPSDVDASSDTEDTADTDGVRSSTADGEASDPDGVTIPDAEGEDGATDEASEKDDGISFDEDVDGDAVPFSDRDPPGEADGDEDAEEDGDDDDDGGLLGGLLG